MSAVVTAPVGPGAPALAASLASLTAVQPGMSARGPGEFAPFNVLSTGVAPHPSRLPFSPVPAPAPLLPPTQPLGCPMEAGAAGSSLLHPGSVNPGGFMDDGSGAWRIPDLVGRVLPTGEPIVARPVTILVPPG
jgi:hypothetical protein